MRKSHVINSKNLTEKYAAIEYKMIFNELKIYNKKYNESIVVSIS